MRPCRPNGPEPFGVHGDVSGGDGEGLPGAEASASKFPSAGNSQETLRGHSFMIGTPFGHSPICWGGDFTIHTKRLRLRKHRRNEASNWSAPWLLPWGGVHQALGPI